MFKIANITKQIFRSARNIGKYSSQSKGCVNAADEFAFESFKVIPPQQSVTKDQFKMTTPIFQETNKLCSIGSYKILEASEIRKLIYARFADEIASKPKKIVDTVTTNDITEEFKIFKEQGYDFATTRAVLQNQNQEANKKNLSERMKELSISGYLSNYAGHPQLREDIEKVIIQKDIVINEFMATVGGKLEELEEYSTELLG